MSHDALVSHLSPYWVHLAGRYTGDTGLIHQCFSEIEKAYNCTGRHYHNLRHIQDLLNLSSQYQPYLYDKDTIDFAIFYHDIIYDVSKSDNEERSAGIAESRLKALKLPVKKIVNIVQYIVGSKTHTLHGKDNETDLAWFLDFDMSILGGGWEIYLQYMQNLRK
jgi:predicted metal-dependent HD superfamily phosphohydrolase